MLRARAEDGFDVGYAVVELPPAQGRTNHTFEMRTAYRALVGELRGLRPRPGRRRGSRVRSSGPGSSLPMQPWTPTEP